MKKSLTSISVILTLVLVSACQSNQQIDLKFENEITTSITPDLISFYIDELDSENEHIPLAQVLFHHGFTLIDQIALWEDDTLVKTYPWESVAESIMISDEGQITQNGETFSPSQIEVIPSPLATEIDWSIMDLSPTIASVLSLPPMEDANGKPLSDSKADHGVLILVDGLQYQKLEKLIAEGKLPFFDQVGTLHQGLTVYPSITTSSTAALLTSALPKDNGVYGYGYRSTEMKTLFDHAVEHGKSVTAVEGHGLAFALRNAEIILSGDRDGDGNTNDNVLASSLESITTQMPDLLFIHFHDVDDEGHEFGPKSPEYEAAIVQVDGYLSQIFQALPPDTFIIIFADHGMQNDPLGTGGNHGYLTQASMIIPIIFLEK